MDAVLNWIWQGAIVVLATMVLLALIRRSRGQDRYVTVWVALCAVLVLPLVPFVWAAAAPAPAVGPVVSMPAGWWTSFIIVAGLWAIWSTVCGVRFLGAVVALRRAKAGWRDVPPEREDRLSHWAEARTRGRRVRMVLSDGVRSAAVLGCGSPVIAIAPALIDHLSAEELDRVVIHEWAHVQRRDDFGHAAELAIRGVAGWHPAVWWLSRQLRLEREIACDEMAVAITGRARAYAACLAKLASLQVTPRTTLPGVAALSSSGLQRRVVRVLSQEHSAPPWASRLASAAVGLLLCAVAFGVGGLRFIEAAAVIDIEAAARMIELALPSRMLASAPITIPAVPAASTGLSDVPSRLRSPQMRQISRAEAAPSAGTVPATAAHSDVQPASPVQEFNESTLADRPMLRAVLFPSTASSTVGAPQVMTSVPPWRAAADGGVAIGRGSQRAAEATAGFISRFGKGVAGAF